MRAFIVALLLHFGLASSACECGNSPSFSQVVKGGKIVALVQVKRFLTYRDVHGVATPMSMEVEVIQLFKGVEERRTLVIWGDLGHLCRPYLSLFGVGKHYVMVLDNGNYRSGHGSEKPTDYAIGNCGVHWLKADLQVKQAFGRISDEPKLTTISFDALGAAALPNSR